MKERVRIALMGLLFVLSCTALPAFAQYTAPIARVSGQMPVEEPFRGTYFDPAKAGTGLFVDYGGNNLLFISYYSFDADGSQKYYLIQGRFAVNDELTRARTGVIGKLADAVVYTTAGGEAVGGAYMAATPHVIDTPVSMTWTAPRRATFTLGTGTWNMVAANFFGTSDADYVKGRWGLSYYVAFDTFDGTRSLAHFTVDFSPAPFGVEKLKLAPNSVAGVSLPPASAKLLVASCVSYQAYVKRCQNLAQGLANSTFSASGIGTVPPTMIAWVDDASGRAGIEMVTGYSESGATLGPENWHFDLYVEPSRMSGHGIHQWMNGAYKDHLDSTFLFEKVPNYLIDFSQ
ncbi:MAG TPA: hypothetical protein PLN91_00830 [Rhodanobacteraceae bacterium]|nr:hypothetical protein [Rhodanobacteraceae bacterium]